MYHSTVFIPAKGQMRAQPFSNSLADGTWIRTSPVTRSTHENGNREGRPLEKSPIERLAGDSLESPGMRRWCIAGIAVSTLLSIASLVLGLLIFFNHQSLPGFLSDTCFIRGLLSFDLKGTYFRRRFAFPCSQFGSVCLVLSFNFVVTALLSAHGRIHTTALLWLLWEEADDGPRYNANSRLFNGTKRLGPCHWTVNILAALTMCICYGATATMAVPLTITPCNSSDSNSSASRSGPHQGVDICGDALILLGVALLIQNLISIWTLVDLLGFKRGLVKTWNTDAVVNAMYFTMLAKPNRSYTEYSDSTHHRQSLHNQVPKVRVLIRIVWAVSALLLVSTCVIIYLAARAGTLSKSWAKGNNLWDDYGLVWAWMINNRSGGDSDFEGTLIQAGMNGLLAIANHCADVVVAFKNDESSWQDAYSRYAESSNAFVPRPYRVHWRSLLLFIFSSGIQTVFSFAFTADALIDMVLIPLIVTTALQMLVAVALEVMARWTPKTGGPSTYGEFALLYKYISRYHLIWT